MREMSPDELRALAADLEVELERLSQLEQEIQRVQLEIQRDPDRARLFYELQALKLHNFYTGCERIFSLIASELNGGMPSKEKSAMSQRALDAVLRFKSYPSPHEKMRINVLITC